MSTGLWFGVIAASVSLLAVVWIGITGGRRRSTVRWMRAVDGRTAHAFLTAELESELADVQPLARCAQWPAAGLVRDDGAEKCAACVRAVERMEHRHR